MSEPPAPIPRKRRTALKVWSAFLVALALFSGVVLLVDWDRRREHAGWLDNWEKRRNLKWSLSDINRPTFERICKRYTPNAMPITYADDERALFRSFFDGRTFGPEYEGWKVEMTFLAKSPRDTRGIVSDDVLKQRAAGAELMYVRAIAPRDYASQPSRLWYDVQAGRLIAGYLAALVWAAAALLVFVSGTSRRYVAQVCVAAAMAVLAAWVLKPGYDWSRWNRDRVLLLIAGGFVFGVLYVLIPYRRKQAKLARCEACRYDLTGNESGVCPECGTTTAAGLARRKHDEVARLAAPLESGPLVYEAERDVPVNDDAWVDDSSDMPNGGELSATGPS